MPTTLKNTDHFCRFRISISQKEKARVSMVQPPLTITKEGDHLYAQLTGQPRLEIFPRSVTEFFYKVVQATITFETDEARQVTGLILKQGGATLRAKKVE